MYSVIWELSERVDLIHFWSNTTKYCISIRIINFIFRFYNLLIWKINLYSKFFWSAKLAMKNYVDKPEKELLKIQ